MLVFSIFIIVIIVIFLFYSFIPSYLSKKIFFSRKKIKEKTIYLTFDDGPSEFTDELLSVLKQYNIKATFFCVADFAKNRKKTIERMKKEKHLIALHSLRHRNSMLQGIWQTKNDLDDGIKIMRELGIEIKYYRPPWGDSNLYLLKRLKDKGLKLVLWDVMAEDWEKNTKSEIIVDKILSRVKEGDIICLHDRTRKK